MFIFILLFGCITVLWYLFLYLLYKDGSIKDFFTFGKCPNRRNDSGVVRVNPPTAYRSYGRN